MELSYKEDLSFHSIDMTRVVKELPKFEVESALIQLGDVKMTDNGTFSVQGQDFDITDGGISNLSKTLRIPDPFVQRIPTDLFIHNVNRLTEFRSNEPVNLYLNTNGHVIDVNTNVNMPQIPLVSIMDLIKERDLEKFRFSFKNHKVVMELIDKTALTVENKHEHKIGSSLIYSITDRNNPVANLMLWTLVCTNGAIAPRKLNDSKLKLNGKNIQTGLEMIKKGLKPFNSLSLAERFEEMENPISISDYEKIFKWLRKRVGSGTAKVEILSSSFNDYEQAKLAKEEDASAEDLSSTSFYDVYYQITDYASNKLPEINIKASIDMKLFAGKMLILN